MSFYFRAGENCFYRPVLPSIQFCVLCSSSFMIFLLYCCNGSWVLCTVVYFIIFYGRRANRITFSDVKLTPSCLHDTHVNDWSISVIYRQNLQLFTEITVAGVAFDAAWSSLHLLLLNTLLLINVDACLLMQCW